MRADAHRRPAHRDREAPQISAQSSVDHDRTVRFIDVQSDYTARTDVSEIIAALTDLT